MTGHNAITIPKVFQLFVVFSVALLVWYNLTYLALFSMKEQIKSSCIGMVGIPKI